MMLVPVIVVVVVQLLAPASARSVTSIALDLIPELEAMFASDSPHVNASDTPPLTEENVNFASEMFVEFLPAIKETMIQQAKAKQRSLDPAVDAQFDKMSRIMPRIIQLFGAIATRPKVDPSLEPALEDFTHTVIEKASDTASNALNRAADEIKKQSGALLSNSLAQTSPEATVSENVVEVEVPSVNEAAPQVAVVSDAQSYSANALQGPNEASAAAQQSYAAGDQAEAPKAFTKFKLDLPVPKEVIAAGLKSTDGSVYYKLPGGGFFYATGYSG